MNWGWKSIYGTFISYWDIGIVKVVGRFQSGLSLIINLATLLVVMGFALGFDTMFFMGVAFFFFVFFAGVGYRKFRLYDTEINRAMSMHPFYTELMERVKNIEVMLKEQNK